MTMSAESWHIFASAVTLLNQHCLLVVRLFVECDDGYFGANCTLECHCADGDVCAKQNGDCPSQCAAGWNGTSCQDGTVS